MIIDKAFEFFVADTHFEARVLIERLLEIGGCGTAFDLLERTKCKAMRDVY